MQKWTAHRMSPIAELFNTWAKRYQTLVWMLIPNPIGGPTTGRFYSRAETGAEEAELVQQSALEPWHPEDETAPNDGNESELDREQREARMRERNHVADVYNTYLRFGWPDSFDKERCRIELLALEKRKDADERRRMKSINPDAAFFN
ncbi:hypothetical protein F5Y04DRAFT_86110 [Hypomontagnella monticulosa]|nr:hypothetical protein F5Y04DRAFT_86110 [Hypomontagnella monticulosa]